MPRRPWAILFLVLSCVCPRSSVAAVVPTDFDDQVVLNGLSEPRALAFLPDGRILFTEQRTGRIRMVVGGAIATQDPIRTITVNSNGYERGLQGIAVDPGWPARPYVYEFHNDNDGFNRLLRWTASGALSDPGGQSLTLSDPLALLDDVRDVDPNHNGGCLRFGPDGMLYVSLGEDEVVCDAQDSTSLRGQILRLDVTGIPDGATQVFRANLLAHGNPLSTADSNAMLVFAYGLRNPWSFQVDPAGVNLYAADVGEADFEEINEIVPGGNYGWPYREGPLVLTRPACPEPNGAGSNANGWLPPIASLDRDFSLHAFVTGAFYRTPAGAAFPWPAGMQGSVLYADYYDGAIKRLARDTGGAWGPAPPVPGQPSSENWGEDFVSLVDGQIAANGDLWLLTQFNAAFDDNSGQLHRIRFTGVPAGVPAVPAAITLGAAPNPFRQGTTLSFRLERAARVRLVIHDLAGRHVRTIAEAEFAAGVQRTTWDGTDDAGNTSRPGLYLARLELDGRPAGRARLLRVR